MIQSTLYKYNTQEESTTNLTRFEHTIAGSLNIQAYGIKHCAGMARVDNFHLQQLCIGPKIQMSIQARLTEKRQTFKSQSLTGLQRIGGCLSIPMRYSSLERTLHLLQYQLRRSR